jgi:hypothetical protein
MPTSATEVGFRNRGCPEDRAGSCRAAVNRGFCEWRAVIEQELGEEQLRLFEGSDRVWEEQQLPDGR